MNPARTLILAALLTGAAFGQAREDATRITGTGQFPFDTGTWQRWEASASGPFSVSTCGGTEFDTVIEVFESASADAPLARNDDACGSQSQARFDAQAGTPYFIRVGSTQVEGSGTFRIQSLAPGGIPYCTSGPNSVSGAGSAISMTGSTSAAANDLVLQASGLPAGTPGLFYFGEDPAQLPFGDGFRCVGGRTLRFPATVADGTGHATFATDNHVYPATQLGIGLTVYFQFWYRDAAGPRGTGFNQSNGLELTFLP